MNLRFSAVAVVVLTLVSTLGQPSPAASAPIPGDHPGVSRVVLTDAEGHRSAAAMAGGPDRATEAISTGVVEVDEFLVAGLTWDAGERLGVGTDIRMRVREDRGWSQWLDVEPDAAADRGARAGTEPFVTGGADAVQVVVTGSSADLPAELELNLISPADEGTSTTWSSATSSAASVAEASPAIVDTPAGVVHTRADWGLTAAEEQMVRDGALVGYLWTRIPDYFKRFGWVVCGRRHFWRAGAREVLAGLSARGLHTAASKRLCLCWRAGCGEAPRSRQCPPAVADGQVALMGWWSKRWHEATELRKNHNSGQPEPRHVRRL